MVRLSIKAKRNQIYPRFLGQSLGEYSIVLALVAIVSIPLLGVMGAQSTESLQSVNANGSQFDHLSGLMATKIAPTNQIPFNAPQSNLFKGKNSLNALSENGLDFEVTAISENNAIKMMDKKTTTSIEGSTALNSISNSFSSLSKANNSLSPQILKNFNELSDLTSKLSTTQQYFDNIKFNDDPASRKEVADKYAELQGFYKNFLDASDKIKPDELTSEMKIKFEKLVTLAANITYQNYLNPSVAKSFVSDQVQHNNIEDPISRSSGLLRFLYSSYSGRTTSDPIDQVLKNKVEAPDTIIPVEKTADATDTKEISTKMKNLPNTSTQPATADSSGAAPRS
ncbi:MAG: hypothetical protein K2X66_04385 [Cyanobacteria bacterium]|nr:hypothetical protein [Cyanobacteriota bacterium]